MYCFSALEEPTVSVEPVALLKPSKLSSLKPPPPPPQSLLNLILNEYDFKAKNVVPVLPTHNVVGRVLE
ncbi:unnamed protein product, partial [Bubo scandiacus]